MAYGSRIKEVTLLKEKTEQRERCDDMKERELLFSVTKKDFRIYTFRAGGKGGQKQNKTSSGVRFTHIESGAVGESREERSQHRNKEIAFKRCVDGEWKNRYLSPT